MELPGQLGNTAFNFPKGIGGDAFRKFPVETRISLKKKSLNRERRQRREKPVNLETAVQKPRKTPKTRKEKPFVRIASGSRTHPLGGRESCPSSFPFRVLGVFRGFNCRI